MASSLRASKTGILGIESESGLAARDASAAAIVTELEEDVVLGRLHPRERLIEEDLVDRFGAKRHVVRQALADLERMGLVQRIPNRGALVRAFNPVEVEQLYAVRDLLETHAARLLLLPLPRSDLEEIKAIQRTHDDAVRKKDLRHVFRSNLEFHRALFAKIGNPHLTEVINDFAQRTHGIRFYSITDPRALAAARDEHWLLIKAIERGDQDSLLKLCSQHLLASKEAYLREYKRVAR